MKSFPAEQLPFTAAFRGRGTTKEQAETLLIIAKARGHLFVPAKGQYQVIVTDEQEPAPDLAGWYYTQTEDGSWVYTSGTGHTTVIVRRDGSWVGIHFDDWLGIPEAVASGLSGESLDQWFLDQCPNWGIDLQTIFTHDVCRRDRR